MPYLKIFETPLTLHPILLDLVNCIQDKSPASCREWLCDSALECLTVMKKDKWVLKSQLALLLDYIYSHFWNFFFKKMGRLSSFESFLSHNSLWAQFASLTCFEWATNFIDEKAIDIIYQRALSLIENLNQNKNGCLTFGRIDVNKHRLYCPLLCLSLILTKY